MLRLPSTRGSRRDGRRRSRCRPRRCDSSASSSATRAPRHGLPREAAAGSRRARHAARLDGPLRLHGDVLVRAITEDAGAPTRRTTSAATSCRRLVDGGRLFAYDFSTNTIPGTTENERGYWRDVGTIDAYWQASVDLISVQPAFNLYNPAGRSLRVLPEPAGQVRVRRSRARTASASPPTRWSRRAASSAAATSTARSSARACASTASRTSTESILFDDVDVGRHARVRRAIVDKGVVIPAGMDIGYDADEDRAASPSARAGCGRAEGREAGGASRTPIPR